MNKTYEELQALVMSLSRQLKEAKAALAACEMRENDPSLLAARNLIERIRAGL